MHDLLTTFLKLVINLCNYQNYKTIYNSLHNSSIFSTTSLRSVSAADLQLRLAAFSIAGPTSCSYFFNKLEDMLGISKQDIILFISVRPTPA